MKWNNLDGFGPAPTLSDEERVRIVAHWKRRAASERRIGRGFAAIAPRLRAVGAPRVVVEGMTEAAAEESRHAELCVAMAARYAGCDPGEPIEPAFEMPDFRTGDERLELLFLVVGTCCINETLAVAYIRACMDAAEDPGAKAANRAHLREEIGHGRLGWALLGSRWVDDRLRTELSARLPRLLAANVPLWLREDPELGPLGMPRLGHPSAATIAAVIDDTVRNAVVPGLQRAGLDTPLETNSR